jgi:hypothetical protein
VPAVCFIAPSDLLLQPLLHRVHAKQKDLHQDVLCLNIKSEEDNEVVGEPKSVKDWVLRRPVSFDDIKCVPMGLIFDLFQFE